jgi:hypothetical protein
MEEDVTGSKDPQRNSAFEKRKKSKRMSRRKRKEGKEEEKHKRKKRINQPTN